MKKILFLICAVMMLPVAASAGKTKDTSLKVMSYNIRYGSAKDGTNSWDVRCPATVEMLRDKQPDVFGVQEAQDNQQKFIIMNCPEYKYIGVGRVDGKHEGEHMSIFYNKKRIKVLKWGTYWLSETPDVPSKGWDSACIRTATWAYLKDKQTGRKFYYVNTHLDHVGKEARKKGLALVMDNIAAMNPSGLPMVLTGDFNVLPDDPCLTEVNRRMKSARSYAEDSDTKASYNGWGHSAQIIDYIYYAGFSKCTDFKVVDKKYANRPFVSDHYPVIATLQF